MKRPSQNHFAALPGVNMQRSAFDMPMTYKTTLDSGYIVPIMQPLEILPGDSLNLRITAFARLATLITPIMDNLKMAFFFFFVPNRLVWDDWEEFICADVNGPQGLVPQIQADDPSGFPVGSLADYYGLPPGVSNIKVSVLPFRGYNLIFNEWFRREDLVSSAVVNTGSTDEAWSDGDYTLRRRCKRPDMFVQCNLWPQKGPGVELPLGDTAPVVGNGMSLGFTNGTNKYQLMTRAVSGSYSAVGIASGVGGSVGDGATFASASGSLLTGVSRDPAESGLVADLSQATAATINSLRQAFQIQRLFERDALAGNGRYVEVLKSHFQVTSPDARLQRPEYLGGGVVPVSIHTITQTSQTATTPQGNLVGNGVVAGDGIGFSKSFVEHGFVHAFACVYGEATYQQGIDRMWSRRGRFDYYWPVLAHLGEQAILNKEIFAQGSTVVDSDGNVIDDLPFGYQERWSEYRYGLSKITGKLRSGVSGSLDVWHLAQQFSSLPVLGETFVEENPPISRVVAVTNEPQFIYDSVIRARFVRPMPMYSVPGLVDHF